MTDSEENACLRAAIMTIHEHLHKGDVEAAHKASHDAVHGTTPRIHQPNLTLSQSNRVALFSRAMVNLAEQYELDRVVWLAALPSATQPGAFSFQIGGNVELCQWVKDRIQ
jgi:hypothetical protein